MIKFGLLKPFLPNVHGIFGVWFCSMVLILWNSTLYYIPLVFGTCGSYVVHHFNSTELRCAPPTLVCAQGGPALLRSRGHPKHFSFFQWFTWNALQTDTFCPDTECSHSVVHNVHSNQSSHCSSVLMHIFVVHNIALH